MPDPLQPFPPDTISPLVSSAATGNALLAAARDWRAQRRGAEGPPNGAGRPQVQPALTVWVRNDTGGSLPAFSVLALGEPVASPADEPYVARDRPVFPGTAPAGSTDAFAVTTEPAKVGGLVRATVTGVTPAYLSVSDEAHAYAAPAAATTSTLASGATGPARVVWKESGTGAKWGMVLLGRDAAAADGYTPPNPSTGAAVSCGWLAGLLSTQCLTLTVLGATGLCADIDADQELTLAYDTGTWVSETDFSHDGGAGPAVFSVTADGVPKLTIDGVVGVQDGCGVDGDGNHYADWAFGGSTLCDGTPGDCGGNIFRARLTCGGCPPPDPCCDDRPMPAELILTVSSPECPTLNKVVILTRQSYFGSPTSFFWNSSAGDPCEFPGVPYYWAVECDGFGGYQLRLTPQNMHTETLTLSCAVYGLVVESCNPMHLTFTYTGGMFPGFNPAACCNCPSVNPTTVTIDIVE